MFIACAPPWPKVPPVDQPSSPDSKSLPSGRCRRGTHNKINMTAIPPHTSRPGVSPPMKKLLVTSLILALCATTAHAGPVKIPDKGLEEALKKVLLEPKEGLTDENLVN